MAFIYGLVVGLGVALCWAFLDYIFATQLGWVSGIHSYSEVAFAAAAGAWVVLSFSIGVNHRDD